MSQQFCMTKFASKRRNNGNKPVKRNRKGLNAGQIKCVPWRRGNMIKEDPDECYDRNEKEGTGKLVLSSAEHNQCTSI